MIFIKQNAKNEKPKSGKFKAEQLFAFGFAFSVFVTSLTVLVFMTGCEPVKPEIIESVKAQQPEPEPAKIEPVKVEPAKVEPAKIEPPKVEPPEVEPPKTEPPKVEPAKVEPVKVKPVKVETEPSVSFHDKCADILKNYVDNKGMVDYKRLKRKQGQLGALLNEFAKLDPNFCVLSRKFQDAFGHTDRHRKHGQPGCHFRFDCRQTKRYHFIYLDSSKNKSVYNA